MTKRGGTAMHPTITAMIDVTIGYLRGRAQELALTDAMLSTIRPGMAPVPKRLPVVADLTNIRSAANAQTRAVCDALMDAAPQLWWRQTYSEDDGFDRRYLNSYGWIDMISDDGPYHADGFRLMAGYWGKGLDYPSHSHPPEEHYIVLAGGMWIRLNNDPWEWCGPGAIFHVPAGAVHSASMRDGPLLALSIWRADDTRTRINLTDQDRDVVLD